MINLINKQCGNSTAGKRKLGSNGPCNKMAPKCKNETNISYRNCSFVSNSLLLMHEMKGEAEMMGNAFLYFLAKSLRWRLFLLTYL